MNILNNGYGCPLLGHVEGDGVGFSHLLEFDHGEAAQSAARRNFLELVRELLCLLEGWSKD